jgi:hypothetical protein
MFYRGTRVARLALIGAMLVCGASGLTGCQSAQTQYIFATADLDDHSPTPKLTFYRVKFDGSARNVKASYQAGFYDADALRQLFGEVSKPSDAAKEVRKNPTGSYLLRYDEETKKWVVVDDGQRFTIMYGANSDAMASQVQAFADSDDVGKQMGSLLAASAGAGTFQAAEQVKQKVKVETDANKALSDKLTASAAKIADTAVSDDVRKALLVSAQDAAKAANVTLTSLPADPSKLADTAAIDAAVKAVEDELSKLSK